MSYADVCDGSVEINIALAPPFGRICRMNVTTHIGPQRSTMTDTR
jgi:hypothetical protein